MLTWKIEPHGAQERVIVTGRITEETPLAPLADAISASQVVLDLAAVERINSLGCREWLLLMQTLENRGIELALERCSVAFVQQLAMILGFAGNGVVRSVYAPYCCAGCGHEELILLSLDSELGPSTFQTQTCRPCGGTLEFDDLPENYQTLSIGLARRASS